MGKNAETPETAQGATPEKNPRKPRKRKDSAYSMRGKTPEQQRDILESEIKKHEDELKILRKKLDTVNTRLKEKDLKWVKEHFTTEELQALLQQSKN